MVTKGLGNLNVEGAERCPRITARPPSESAVKARFYKLSNSLQQTINNARSFPILFSHSILTLVSNCINLRSASSSFWEDGCAHRVKSILRLAKRPKNLTTRIRAHGIYFSHAKRRRMSLVSNPKNPRSVPPLLTGLESFHSCTSQNLRQRSKRKRRCVSWKSKWGITPHISSPNSQ